MVVISSFTITAATLFISTILETVMAVTLKFNYDKKKAEELFRTRKYTIVIIHRYINMYSVLPVLIGKLADQANVVLSYKSF